jgi:hypothetical protein
MLTKAIDDERLKIKAMRDKKDDDSTSEELKREGRSK